MNNKHTDTPWYTVDAGDEYCFDIDAKTESGWPATLATAGRANAAFIVRACNAHDDLVKALQDIIDDCSDACPPSYGAIKQAAKQALAKATHE